MSEYYEQTLVIPGHPVTKKVTQLDPARMPRLVYLLNDAELWAKYPTLCKRDMSDNAPMTAELITDRETFPFDRRVQEFLYSLNPNVPRSAFGALFNTWFPGIKGETKIDDDNFISDPNYGGEVFAYHADLTLAGNTYMATGAPCMRNGLWVYRLKSIDVTLPLPEVIPYWQKTYLTVWSAGKVIRFPQGGGNDCFSALLSCGADLFIDARRVEEVFAPPVPYRW